MPFLLLLLLLLLLLRQRAPLHEQKIISDEELADLKASVSRAEADKARAEATLGLAEKALRDCRVRPPIAGRINAKRVSTGEYVKAEAVLPTERGFVAFVLEGGKARERRLVPGIQAPDGRLEVVEGLRG